jgi:hypothetical protein
VLVLAKLDQMLWLVPKLVLGLEHDQDGLLVRLVYFVQSLEFQLEELGEAA